MNISWKTCFRLGLTVLIVYLGGFYWNSIVHVLSIILGASKPIIIGLMVAYILNILMVLYEKHYFNNSKNPFILKTKRVVCMLCAFLTFIGLLALVFAIVIPELVMCIKLIIAEIPPVVDKFLQNDLVEMTLPEEVIQMVADFDWNELFTKITHFLTNGIGSALNTV
ncbi:MAG: hypothetical protein ACI4U3_00950, partial [Traorella sp.]